MVKLIIEFKKRAIKRDGLTEEELLRDIRKFVKDNDIIESKYAVFEKDGEDAFCLLCMIVINLIYENKKINYLDYLKKLELNDNGEKEDCIENIKGWIEEEKLR